MALATLSIDLVAKLAQFEKDMGQAARVAEQHAARVQKAMGAAGTAIAGLLGGVTVGSIVAITRAQIDAIDGFNDLGDATGASIENISALDSLARRTGVSFDTVGSTLVKFNDSLKEGDKAGVFKALNLDIEKLKQLDPAEALRQTAVALAGFADDGSKARAVQELFGRSLREVAPLLKDLAEEGQLNATVTQEQAEQAEKFNKELFAMQATMSDLTRMAVMPAVSWFNRLAEEYKRAREEGVSLLGVLTRFSLPGLLFGLGGTGDSASRMAENRSGIANLDTALLDPTLSASERAAMQNERARLVAARNAGYANSLTGDESTDALSRRFGRTSLTLPDEKKGRDKKAADDKAWLDNRKEWLRRYDEQEKERKAIEDRAAKDLEGWMQRWSQEGDALSRRLASQEAATERMAALNAELDSLSGRTGDDRKRALTEQLEARLNAGEQFTPEQLDRMVNGIAGITAATQDAQKVAINFADVFDSSFERALLKGEKLSSVLNGLGQDMLQMVLRQTVTKPMADMVGGWVSGAFSGVLPSFDVGTDYVPRDMVAKIHKGERIIPAAQNRSGGMGGVTVVNHNTFGDVASMAQVQAEMRQSERRTVSALRRAQTYGSA